MLGEKVIKIFVNMGLFLLVFLLVLGLIGLIVYFCLFDVGKLKFGEIVVVFAVVGVVGFIVC